MPRKPDERLQIDTIRTLAMDAVEKAQSGHPGTPMALAPVAYLLFDRFLRYNPRNPAWPNRDRFVLSAGHASMLLYGTLHLAGFDLPLEEIRRFRQLHSRTPGHPEFGLTPGVETTTGPLGQGAGNSVGMAIAERWLAARFNRPGHAILGYRVVAICSDGDLMEGVSHEAASIAGHLGLGNLVWIYDNNRITIEGKTDLAFSEDVAARFAGYGWRALRVADVNDLDRVEAALDEAMRPADRPTLIVADSHIAWGAPNAQDTAEAHGAPLGAEEVRRTKQVYGWDPDRQFHVPEEAARWQEEARRRGARAEAEWVRRFEAYAREFPEPAAEFRRIQEGRLPEGIESSLPEFPPDAKGQATRAAGGKVLNALAARVPWLLGGSADLAPSTKTLIDGSESIRKGDFSGRNLHFGVREHAMGGILNGMALSRLRPYGASFLIFSDYCRPAIRLAALTGLPVIYVFTHDSIGLGEDGPTHQPVEHLASLRAIPNLDVIRPADANEVAWAWLQAIRTTDRPVLLALSRQSVPTLDRREFARADGVLRGGYVLADTEGTPELVLIGTGSEVALCVEARKRLAARGIRARVVSLPCVSLFARQEGDYRDRVLPPGVRARVAVEAGSSWGWDRFVGPDGAVVGIDRFGASAPFGDLFRDYGITVDRVVETALEILERTRRARPD
ncbi:MAG: transketolase [Acidobacteria bacterium]|nr:transketolase [Acidobacteriota bacterium]